MELLKLPAELLLLILPYLHPADISILSRVCKEAQKVLLPYLYNKIDWDLDSYNKPAPPPAFSVWLLIRSILEKAQLGHLIEHIDLTGEIYPPKILFEDEIPTSGLTRFSILLKEFAIIEAILRPFEAKIKSSPTYYANDDWVISLRQGKPDGFITLLLALTPNLKTLKLAENIFIHQDYQWLIIDAAQLQSNEELSGSETNSEYLTLSFLSQLQSASFLPFYGCVEELDVRESNEMMAPFLYLPQLSKLEGYIQEYESSIPGLFTRLPPRSNSLRVMTLRDAIDVEIAPDSLEILLPITPNLKRLRLEYDLFQKFDLMLQYDSLVTDNLAIILDLNGICPALHNVKSSLESLELVMKPSVRDGIIGLHNCGIAGRIQSLKELERLEKLEVPFVALFGFHDTANDICRLQEILPSHLKYLCLQDDLAAQDAYTWKPRDWFNRVDDLLAVRAQKFPRLLSIKLSLLESISDWENPLLNNWQTWSRMCQDAGVSFNVNCKFF